MRLLFLLNIICAVNCFSMDKPLDLAILMPQLFKEIKNSNYSLVQKIITEFPQTINSYCAYGDSKILCGEVTPLHLTVYKENLQLTLLLLVHNADCNALTKGYRFHDTPLHFAANPDIAKALLDNGASVGAKNEFGYSPLYVALFERGYPCMDVAEILINHGANVNECDGTLGQTLLHVAIRENREVVEIIKLLLKYGADKTVQNAHRQTPFQYAQQMRNGFGELLDLLQ
jgi:hypothetical protein